MTFLDLLTKNNAIAYLFPGQGSQTVGMGAEVAAAYPAARAAFEEADDVLGFKLSTLCFQGPDEVLTDTVNAQPALLATSIALLRAIETESDTSTLDGAGDAVFVAGHSLGEYSALVACGSISYADGLRLVRTRGRLMQEAGAQRPGLMAAILGLEEATVAAICADSTAAGGIAQVANDNCPGQVVISGDKHGMEQAMAALDAAGARKVVLLAVSIAAHSPLMEPAVAELADAVRATPIREPAVPLIANTSAAPLRSPDEIRAELVAQLTGSVRWTDSMRFAREAGVGHFVEIGPGDVLTALMKRIDRKAHRRAVSDPDGVRSLVDSFSTA